MPTCSVLFVLKARHDSWGTCSEYAYNHGYFPSGLFNSASFIEEMLIKDGIRCGLVQVVDGNDIDREVVKFNADVVILEAIWCPPSKLKELTNLSRHKSRTWVVRNHSELPFLAQEGIALQWLLEYAAIPRVIVSCNSPVANDEISSLLSYRSLSASLFLPNYYPTDTSPAPRSPKPGTIRVGCFGAVRPLKNHVEQAVGSLLYSHHIGATLEFHINATRIEGHGDPILKTLRSIFSGTPDRLVEHGWLDRKKFLNLCGTMDIGLQVSFSETFCIVAADLVSQGTPTVTSPEVPWMPLKFCASPTSAESIFEKMRVANHPGSVVHQFNKLKTYARNSRAVWLSWLSTFC